MALDIPLTGNGGTTATVATESIGSAHYQYFKLVSGVAGSTVEASVLATTPVAAEDGLVVRPIGSTAFSQAAVLVAGSSANVVGSVTNAAGSSAVMMGGVALSSGNPVYLGAGTTATSQFVQTIAYSSANLARTTVNTSADVSIIAANANRKALIIASNSTAQTVALSLSTAAPTTGLANANLYLPATSYVTFGLPGGLPLFTGPIRGINITSTAVAGGVSVCEFT
tara:strand:- start:6541 stop:7218 length:678 start_codon:yes stop_codon:yes gene_type:complete